MNILSRLRYSLFAQLTALFLIAGILLFVMVFWTQTEGRHHYFRKNIHPVITQYLDLLGSQLDDAPDIQSAKKVADQLPLDIHIYGPDFSWSSAIITPDINTLKTRFPKHIFNPDKIKRKRPHQLKHHQYYRRPFPSKDRQLFFTQQGDYSYFFEIKRKPFTFIMGRYGLLLLLWVATILVLIYFFTRHLFRPVKDIETGVEQFAAGQFDYRIPIRRQDQIGALTHKINDMAQEIEAMLESKRQLLLAISHELRSPLARSKVHLALLDESDSKNELSQNINEMDDLIQELLETERLNSTHQSLQLEPTQVNILIEQTLDEYYDADNFSVTLESVHSAIDPIRFKLLLKNLLDNARKHHQSQQKIEIALTRQNEHFALTIKDYGPGIAKESLPYLTEPFYRVDPSRQRKTGGYGLGLYLCKMIVEAHQGSLSIQSELGQFTKIQCLFPTR